MNDTVKVYDVIVTEHPLMGRDYIQRVQYENDWSHIRVESDMGVDKYFIVQNLNVRKYFINNETIWAVLPPELLSILELEEERMQDIKNELEKYKRWLEMQGRNYKCVSDEVKKYKTSNFWNRLKYLFKGYL